MQKWLDNNDILTYSTHNPAGTRRPSDIPWRCPKDPNIWYVQGMFRGISEDQYKNRWFHHKTVFWKH